MLYASIVANADLALAYPSPAHFNGDDAIALVKDNAGTLEIIDIIGDPLNRPTDGWDVAGVTAATKDHTLIRKTTITTGNTDWSASASSEWEVQDKDYWDNMGSHGESQSSNTAPIASVTIAGTTTVGETLTADTSASSDIDGDTLTFTYQWYRADDSTGTNETMISGSTSSTYLLTTDDQDKFVTVKVVANDGTEDSAEVSASYTEQVVAATSSPSVIFSESFETDGSGSRYTLLEGEFNDTFSDYFTRTDGTTIGDGGGYITFDGSLDGSFFFAAQDLDGDGYSPEQTITFTGIDISGQSNLSFSILLAEDDSNDGKEDWDDNDYFIVEYQIDGGGYKNLLAVRATEAGTNFAPAIDTNFDGVGDGTEITSTWADFSASISETGATLDIKIIVGLGSGDEDIAFDNLRVSTN